MDINSSVPSVNPDMGKPELSGARRTLGLISATLSVIYTAGVLALRFHYSKHLIFNTLDIRLGYQYFGFLIAGVLVAIFAFSYAKGGNTLLLRLGGALTAAGYLLTFLGGIKGIEFDLLFEPGYIFEDASFLAFLLSCLGAGVLIALFAVLNYGLNGARLGNKVLKIGLSVFAGIILVFDVYWFVDLLLYLIEADLLMNLGSMKVYFIVEGVMIFRFVYILPYLFLTPCRKRENAG